MPAPCDAHGPPCGCSPGRPGIARRASPPRNLPRPHRRSRRSRAAAAPPRPRPGAASSCRGRS
ncbi:MAG: hypothetical protein EPN79_00180 [Burkholderiaceae bacterium]|nr:MAG: hypothetical protein EPN79_00180 [Burkholderiaceae bacterium]